MPSRRSRGRLASSTTGISGRSCRTGASSATARMPQQRQAGLRLDEVEAAFKPSESGADADRARQAGEQRVWCGGSSPRTPTSGCRRPTAARSFRPPSGICCGAGSPREPSIAATGRSCRRCGQRCRKVKNESPGRRNPIDRFILARLEAGRLAPSPQARRQHAHPPLTLDLTGLPPTLAEVDAFLADTPQSAIALERLVDRLLAVAPLRRAHGAGLARRRPLRRHARLPHRQRPRHVAVARVGDRRLQPQPAVRPVHRRAARRRPAARTRRSSRRSPAGSTATT